MTATMTFTELTDPLCLPEAELVDLLRSLDLRRFAVVGDSLSRGTGDATPGYRELGWSDRVAELLRRAHPDATYLTTALVGVTTPEVLRDQLDVAVAFGPDLLHLPSGANDILARDPDRDAIERDLRRLWERAGATGAALTAFTFGRSFAVPAIPDWDARVRHVNDVTRGLAEEHHAVLVDMWDHPVNDRPYLLSADRIHWSTSGQAVMATEVVRALAAGSGPHRQDGAP